MSLVHGRDALVHRYVTDGLGIVIAEPYRAIGSTKDGKSLNGGVVFNRWNGFDIEIHLYGPGCITRDHLRGVFEYVFVHAGAIRATAITKRSNKTMLKLLPRLGFEFECPRKRYFGIERSNDGMQFVLFPELAIKWMT